MPWFEYDGLTPGGTAVAGRVEAPDVEAARAELGRMRVNLRTVTQTTVRPTTAAGISRDDFVFFNEQLASLAQAGIALDQGLLQLARDVESPRLRGWIQEIAFDVAQGQSLDAAIARREAGLPLLYSQVIRAGVASGELPATLLNLNQHLRLAGRTRRILWEVTSYPLVAGLLAFTVISLFYTFVVPKLTEIFKDFGTELPAMTIAMLAIGEHYPTILVAVASVVVLAALFWRTLCLTEAGVALREYLLLRLPVIGRVHEASLVASFLRAVATSVASGIPLPQAMRLSAGATGSPSMIRDAEHIASEVERGQSIFVANQTARMIPPLFGFAVQVAKGREALPASIAQLARAYESRAAYTQSLLRVLLLPGIIVILGGFISFAVVATFLPLVHLINAVSSGG